MKILWTLMHKNENPVDLDAQEDGAKNEESGSEK